MLHDIKTNPNIIIASADKGLGPVGMDTSQYIDWGMSHLADTSTYEIISENTALADATSLRKEIFQWTRDYRENLTDEIVHYIRHHLDTTIKDPFGYFYLLIKLHKTPISTRPVCSDCASLPHALGKWVDTQLQPIVQRQKTYFKNSQALKHLLDNMHLPSNAKIFTYNAISMYTNIDTEDCIARISTYLLLPTTLATYPHLSPHALIDALAIVMRNNRMRFGDLFVRQHKGIAMGMSPAPTIANLYVAIFEEQHLLQNPPSSLPFLRRFIDDGFGIWLTNDNHTIDEQQWDSFKSKINNMGLTWEFSDRSDTVTFMDLTISLDSTGKFHTKIYAKPMALHLYIPPNSCHAPGVTTGLIFGHILRVHQLCSHQKDINKELHLFYKRLIGRGHSPSTILPLFSKAEENARERVAKEKEALVDTPEANATQDKSNYRSQLFFHLPYHPSNPSSTIIQKIWRDTVASPHGLPELIQLKNRSGFDIPIEKLTIAYSRAPNLGNILSCRKLKTCVVRTVPQT
jgi:hypothetical protein